MAVFSEPSKTERNGENGKQRDAKRTEMRNVLFLKGNGASFQNEAKRRETDGDGATRRETDRKDTQNGKNRTVILGREKSV